MCFVLPGLVQRAGLERMRGYYKGSFFHYLVNYLKASPCHRPQFWGPWSIFGVRDLFLGSRTPPYGFGSSRNRDFTHRELLACHFCRNSAIFVISVISGDHGFCWSQLELAGVTLRKGLGRTWILPGLAGFRLGQRKVVLTRSTAEGVGGFKGH